MNTNTILHESFLATMRLNKLDRFGVASFIRPRVEIDIHSATNICQMTFLCGYHYAEKGVDGLDGDLLKMYKNNYTILGGVNSNKNRNRFDDFFDSNNIAVDLFKEGMNLYLKNIKNN